MRSKSNRPTIVRVVALIVCLGIGLACGRGGPTDPSGTTTGVFGANQGVVRFVYLVPADKTLKPQYLSGIERAAVSVQFWYWEELGTRSSFELSSPIVEVMDTPHPSAWYAENRALDPVGFWNNVVDDGLALTGGIRNDGGTTWVFYIDADPACGQLGEAGLLGVAALPANDLRGLVGEQNQPPCPNEQPDNANAGVCRWIGGLGHELGHAFGLSHPPGCEGSGPVGCSTSSLMWLGFRVFPNTFLRFREKLMLRANPFIVPLELTQPGTECDERA